MPPVGNPGSQARRRVLLEHHVGILLLLRRHRVVERLEGRGQVLQAVEAGLGELLIGLQVVDGRRLLRRDRALGRRPAFPCWLALSRIAWATLGPTSAARSGVIFERVLSVAIRCSTVSGLLLVAAAAAGGFWLSGVCAVAGASEPAIGQRPSGTRWRTGGTREGVNRFVMRCFLFQRSGLRCPGLFGAGRTERPDRRNRLRSKLRRQGLENMLWPLEERAIYRATGAGATATAKNGGHCYPPFSFLCVHCMRIVKPGVLS